MDYPGKVIRKTPVTPTQASASGVWTVDDALQAVKTNTWPIAGVPNPISRSLRFDYFSSAYLDRTPASTSNRRTWTWSGWIKLGTEFGTRRMLFGGGAAFVAQTLPNTYIEITDGNVLGIDQVTATTGTLTIRVRTSAVLRDPSAWYHVIVAVDTTQGTDTNRVKMYINGVQQTSFSSTTYPTSNLDTGVNTTTNHKLGSYVELSAATLYFDGYMAEVNFIDGQQLAASDFGLTDPQTGQWVPKKYTGTYGTNGFYLNFSDNSSTGTLGYDYSGNGNNWTANNFSVTAGAGNDSLTDVPTPWIAYSTTGDVGGVARGNYCTLNPLDKGSAATLTNGNLDIGSASNPNNNCRGTFGMSSGKWYFEFVITSAIGGVPAFGIGSDTASLTSNFSGDLYLYLSNGTKAVNGVETAYGATFTQNDVIGVAFDADNNSITFYKNNSSQGAITGVTSGLTWRPFVHASITATITSNFGQRPFAYAPPAGFRSLCTTNLPTPTIGATSTTQANDYFNSVLYTGDGNTTKAITVGFQPDFVWIKSRSVGRSHRLTNVISGVSNATLYSDLTSQESSGPLSSFDSNGFTLNNTDNQNILNETYVSWNWKANGAGSNNTAGSIQSTVSASTLSGFSIVTYTGNGTSGATVGHGLGVTPSMVILKRRDAVSNWQVKHVSLNANQNLELNSTAAVDTAPGSGYISAISSTTLTLLNGGSAITNVNANTGTYLVYCFAPIAGYSAFGSYTGNGSTDGTFVYTGFRPEFVMVKNISAISYWQINDAARNPYNLANLALHPNTSGAEATYSNAVMDILSNGFKLRGNDTYTNTNGNIYIYAAFAEFPFKFSNAR